MYNVKKIKEVVERTDDGEEEKYYLVSLTDEATEEKASLKLYTAPKYSAGDAIDMVLTHKQQKLEKKEGE